jgi:taurine-pyruvate aminotransferase
MDGNLPNDLSEVVANDKAHVWHHLIQNKIFETVDPNIIVEGKGLRVWNQAGKEHIDAVSGGVWTVNVGYGRESMADTVRDQLVKMNYFAGAAGSIPAANFAKRLIEKMPGMSRVYFSNSGSEANEKGFKMIRQIAHKKYGGKKKQDPVQRTRLSRHHYCDYGRRWSPSTQRAIWSISRRFRLCSTLSGIS